MPEVAAKSKPRGGACSGYAWEPPPACGIWLAVKRKFQSGVTPDAPVGVVVRLFGERCVGASQPVLHSCLSTLWKPQHFYSHLHPSATSYKRVSCSRRQCRRSPGVDSGIPEGLAARPREPTPSAGHNFARSIPVPWSALASRFDIACLPWPTANISAQQPLNIGFRDMSLQHHSPSFYWCPIHAH